jgi:hypothetical protein
MFGKNDKGLRKLRAFRDDVLKADPIGQAFVRRLYDRSHEVALILVLNPSLRKRTRNLLDDLLPAIESILQGYEVVLSERKLKKINRLLNAFARKASPELQALIEDVKAELQNEYTMMQFGISVQ